MVCTRMPIIASILPKNIEMKNGSHGLLFFMFHLHPFIEMVNVAAVKLKTFTPPANKMKGCLFHNILELHCPTAVK